MPSAAFTDALALWLARMVASGICSTRPAPKIGVGIRKMTLPAANWRSKFGCEILHALASPLSSTRPLITKSACTPPSGVPSGCRLKRTSRTGPSTVRNDGTRLRAPNALATAICGFVAGLVPPTAGWV